MSKLIGKLLGSSICFVIVVAPAAAGPNVFWTFGLDRHYVHGAGGRAELPAKTMLAATQHARQGHDRRVTATALDGPTRVAVPPIIALATAGDADGRGWTN